MGVPRPIGESIIIQPQDIVPSSPEMKVIGVCNPGGTLFQNDYTEKFYLLLRVVEKTKLKFPKYIAFPRAIPGDKYKVRWEWERMERDVEIRGESALIKTEFEEKIRPTYISHFRLAESEDGINFKVSETPTFFPQEKYEEFGMEDARIIKFEEPINIEGEFYKFLISYVACSEEEDVCTAFAVTNDFQTFVRLPKNKPNIIFFAPCKDVVLFPRKFLNQRTNRREFVALIRPSGNARYMVPSIGLSYSDNLIQWGDHKLFIKGDEKGHVGAGPQPIRCKQGWLIIDHQHRHNPDGTKEYVGRCYLVDLDNPLKILKKSNEFLEPHIDISHKSFVDNVTFPSAAMIKDNKIFIYTGEEDVAIAVHIYDLEEFLDFLNPV